MLSARRSLAIATSMRLTLKRAGNNAPLARLLGAPGASISDRDGKSLDQVAATGSHTGPQREVAGLRAVDFRQDQRRRGLADERVGCHRASGECIAELPAVVGEDDLREGREGGEGEGCGLHVGEAEVGLIRRCIGTNVRLICSLRE